MKKFFSKFKAQIELFFALALVIAVMYFSGVGCPIKYVTGISCAGCGMARASLCLLRLDFEQAFYYHPLVFAMPFVAIYLLVIRPKFRERTCKKATDKFKKIDRIILFTIVFAFVIVYLYRMFGMSNSVVTATPMEGLIMRIIALDR